MKKYAPVSGTAIRSPGASSGSSRAVASRSPAKQAGPATSWGTGVPVFGRPFASYGRIRSGHAAGAYTVRVATWTPACVTAMGRPPVAFVYSTRARTSPCLAVSERPNSVTRP